MINEYDKNEVDNFLEQIGAYTPTVTLNQGFQN